MGDLQRVNPWLSACDLAGPAPADLQGSCLSYYYSDKAPAFCPKSCTAINNNNNNNNNKCLFYLEESGAKRLCNRGLSSEELYDELKALRFRHCCELSVVNALEPRLLHDLLTNNNNKNGQQKCLEALTNLLKVDALAAKLQCEFEEVLSRYDCAQTYSVIHNCTHCKVHPNLFFSINLLSLFKINGDKWYLSYVYIYLYSVNECTLSCSV